MHYKFTFMFAIFFASICSSASAQTSETITGDGSSKVIQVSAKGGFDVMQVKVDDDVLIEGVDYTIEGDGSSNPRIKLVNAPALGEDVKVTGVGDNKDPELKLRWSDNRNVIRVANAGVLVSLLLRIFGL
jgi:hypothetical protein